MPLALSPRKRPRQQRSTATVDAILDGAAHILERHGLEGFNTNAVAARAGVSIGSLYQYFPGKDAVMAALIRRDAQNFLSLTQDAAADDGAWTAALERLVDVAVAHQLDSPTLARILDFEEARLPPDPETSQAEDAMQRLIAEILLRAPGAQPAACTEAAADLLHIARALIDAEGRNPAADRAGLKRRVLRAAFGYLAQPPPVEHR